jgi:hypothetical protein
MTSRRADATVIATLLLVAIAVVGGSILFGFSQGFFASAQITGGPTIQLIQIVGYDARDVQQVKAHDGIDIDSVGECCGTADGLNNVDERISIYLKNNSVEQVFLSEIRIAGAVYNYTTTSSGIKNWNGGSAPHPGEYVILTGHDGYSDGDILQDLDPSMQPGEIITILVDLDRPFKTGRDAQFQIITTDGALFVFTMIMGQDKG